MSTDSGWQIAHALALNCPKKENDPNLRKARKRGQNGRPEGDCQAQAGGSTGHSKKGDLVHLIPPGVRHNMYSFLSDTDVTHSGHVKFLTPQSVAPTSASPAPSHYCHDPPPPIPTTTVAPYQCPAPPNPCVATGPWTSYQTSNIKTANMYGPYPQHPPCPAPSNMAPHLLLHVLA